jgi:hypothetical protein
LEFLGFTHYISHGNLVTLDFGVYCVFEESLSVEDNVEFAHLDSSLEGYILGYKGFSLRCSRGFASYLNICSAKSRVWDGTSLKLTRLIYGDCAKKLFARIRTQELK